MSLKTCCLVSICIAVVAVIVAVSLIIATIMLINQQEVESGAAVTDKVVDGQCSVDFCFNDGDDEYCRENYL